MSICYPSDTDWGCAFTPEQLTEMRNDPEKLRQMKLAEARAWYSLAMLTAWRIGVCPTLIRPLAAHCNPFGTWYAAPVGNSGRDGALPVRTIGALNITPYVTGGVWVNGCGCAPALCSHGTLSQVLLPGPVGDIEWVKIDGDVIAPTRYRVDDSYRLVSIDSTLVFPATQDMAAGPDDEGSFAISYYEGAGPDELIRSAAGYLAAEFYKACMDRSKCRLPRRVTKVARRGVEYEIGEGLFEGGITHIDEVDFVIRLYNPNLLKNRPRIVSPESRARGARTTWIG